MKALKHAAMLVWLVAWTPAYWTVTALRWPRAAGLVWRISGVDRFAMRLGIRVEVAARSAASRDESEEA